MVCVFTNGVMWNGFTNLRVQKHAPKILRDHDRKHELLNRYYINEMKYGELIETGHYREFLSLLGLYQKDRTVLTNRRLYGIEHRESRDVAIKNTRVARWESMKNDWTLFKWVLL